MFSGFIFSLALFSIGQIPFVVAGALDLQLHPVLGVDESCPAAVQVLVNHRAQVNQNLELVACVKLGCIHVARHVFLFIRLFQEEAAGLFPKILGMEPFVVQLVGASR